MNLRPVWATEQDTVSTYPYSKKYSTFSTSPPMAAPITPPGLQIIVEETHLLYVKQTRETLS